jgi:uncharacterized protein YciI
MLEAALTMSLAFLCFASIGRGDTPATASNDSRSDDMAPQTNDDQDDIRFVIVHKPGARWVAGSGVFEQPGIAEHAKYYKGLEAAGKVAWGGPFLDGTGGMMIPAAGLARAEVEALAAADPTVQNGLMVFEIKPWYVVMKP